MSKTTKKNEENEPLDLRDEEVAPDKEAQKTESAQKAEEEPKDKAEDAEPKDKKKEKSKVRDLEDKLKKSAGELEALNDKYLRLAAEYANFKNRTAKEKDELFFTAKSQVIRELLPVFDNLDRAAAFTEDKDKLAEGVGMILNQFAQCLSKLSVSEIEALDKPFDPQTCEAVFHEEDPEKPESTVTQVLQKGYICDGKVIRHAMVKVAN